MGKKIKYIIHSIIIFDSEKYLLTLSEDPNTSIKLSKSAGQVLKELIKCRHTGRPVTREHLFEIVWRIHGLEPSNGNLNQQISIIRKNFIILGLDSSIIITIPKKGLKLNNQLNIKTFEENVSNYKLSSNSKKKTSLVNKLFFLKFSISKIYTKYMITLTIMIVILLSISTTYFYTKKTNTTKFYCCKEINSCSVCTVHPASKI